MFVRARGPSAGRAETGSPKSPALPSWAESSCVAEKSRSKQVRQEERCAVLERMYKERQGTDFGVFPGNNSALCSNLRLKDRPVNHNRKKNCGHFKVKLLRINKSVECDINQLPLSPSFPPSPPNTR